jgi:S-DNA-T family DNA segregation ATPase FtsK/SpoIIIE
VIDLGVTETDTFSALHPSSRTAPVAPAGELQPLAPLPKRVAEGPSGAETSIADPLAFIAELVARATQLLVTLDHDVSGLEAEQDDERKRIESEWQRQQEAVDIATHRLERMRSHARQIAAHKARLAEFEVAANPPLPPRLTEEVTADAFLALMDRLDVELRAAQGITGAIRLPQIALLLNEADVSLKRLAERADETKRQLLEGTEAELNTEGKEALASFEIGTGILERDLALLDRSLPVTARSWTSPPWVTWEPPEVPAGWVRLGALTNTRLPTAPIPYLLPTTCGPGLVIEGGAHRDLALDGVRSLVLRLIAALPPGMAQFSFVDPKGLGESIAPFLALGDYDPALVGRGALVLDTEIETHFEAVTRHIERVISQCLQGRHPTLDDFHDTVGGIVEPYRFVVVLDHPNGLTDRSASLLRSIAENGPRCGVTTIVLRAPRTGSFTRAGQGLPTMPTVKSTADGLVVSASSGSWTLVPDVPPLLALGERVAVDQATFDESADQTDGQNADQPDGQRGDQPDGRTEDRTDRSAGDTGGARDEAAALRTATSSIYERVVISTGVRAREIRRVPVTPASVFTLLGDARRRRLREDLPRTSAPVDPEDRSTWWTGDATDGLGVPVGRTDGRQVASLWFDQAQGGMLVTGPSGSGVTTLLRTVVDGLAVIYPPEECQTLLVGVGTRKPFTGYGVDRLPHARLVTSEADRELALSVLEATVAIVDRRRERLQLAGTARLGLTGHRRQTGERVPRLLLALDGVADLLALGGWSGEASGAAGGAPTDAIGGAASELLARLAAEGPAHGVHLLLADRAATTDQQDWLRGGLPQDLGTTVQLGVSTDLDRPSSPGDAAFVDRSGAVDTCFRIAASLPHERAVTARELITQAAERGFTATPQVHRGDQGAELAPARLASLAGDAARRGERRTPRLLIGEPVGLGSPVELLLRRQEGSNVLVVGEDPGLGQGSLLSALASAVVGHGRHLEAWVLDFMPLDPGLDSGLDDAQEAGFGAALQALGDRAELHVGRRRSLAKFLDQVHRVVQDRLVDDEHDAPARLLVVSGLGRARDFDPRAHATGVDGLDPVEVLAAILRDGPEVGIHTLVWCESVEMLHRRLGEEGLREFGIRVGATMDDDASVTLLDTPDAVKLKQHQALLYDECRGRLVKFRPYELPAPGWELLP